MDKGKKILRTVIIDVIMLGILVVSVYAIMFKAKTDGAKNLFTALVVISIPVIFFTTYMAIAGDKYDYREEQTEEEQPSPQSKNLGME